MYSIADLIDCGCRTRMVADYCKVIPVKYWDGTQFFIRICGFDGDFPHIEYVGESVWREEVIWISELGVTDERLVHYPKTEKVPISWLVERLRTA